MIQNALATVRRNAPQQHTDAVVAVDPRDNLEVLKLLQKAYLGKVKMIYSPSATDANGCRTRSERQLKCVLRAECLLSFSHSECDDDPTRKHEPRAGNQRSIRTLRVTRNRHGKCPSADEGYAGPNHARTAPELSRFSGG